MGEVTAMVGPAVVRVEAVVAAVARPVVAVAAGAAVREATR